jgi:hypothetical protein
MDSGEKKHQFLTKNLQLVGNSPESDIYYVSHIGKRNLFEVAQILLSLVIMLLCFYKNLIWIKSKISDFYLHQGGNFSRGRFLY